MKRVLLCGDLHCGHAVGLTPPTYQTYEALKPLHREMWRFFMETVESLYPIDVAIFNGDLIDGKGHRSGGSELIFSDLLDQVGCSSMVVNSVKAKKKIATFGTPYHGSDGGTDFEAIVAEKTGSEIKDHAFIDVDGVVFDVKHKVGSSTVPHGRHTAVAKERLWNVLWSEYDQNPKADVLIRSHVHYYDFCGSADWLGMTLPALQGPGSKFGTRQCSGVVDFGMVSFDIEGGGYQWRPHLLRLKAGRDQVIKC